jgi:hypothetical protein
MIRGANDTFAAANAAVAEAAAAAALQEQALVQQLQDGSCKATGVSDVRRVAKAGPSRRWLIEVQVRRVHNRLNFSTKLEAACAYDLVKLAIHGSDVKVRWLNLPVALYTQQQVAALQQLLQQVSPTLQLAAVDSAALAYVAAAQAAEAAAQVAVAAAAESAASLVPEQAALFTGKQRPPHDSWVALCRRTWRMIVYRGTDIGARIDKSFSSCLQAACAADLARLALGMHRVTNLPRGIYTGQQVAAMRELLQLERPQWRQVLEKAAAVLMPDAAAPAATTPQLAELEAAAKQAAVAAAAVAVQAVPQQAAAFGAFDQQQQQRQQQQRLKRPIGCKRSTRRSPSLPWGVPVFASHVVPGANFQLHGSRTP